MIPYVRCHHDRKQYLVKTPTAIDFAKGMIGAVLQHEKTDHNEEASNELTNLS